jgi:predicted nucleic acid-binding protein
MILIDTNVIIDALDSREIHHRWAIERIVAAVIGEGGVVNAVTVAELCAGDDDPDKVETDLRRWGLQIVDVPAASATVCGRAYRRYLTARRASKGGVAPKTPLADFFIGAHAEVMRWKIATRDQARFRRYFPRVTLITP